MTIILKPELAQFVENQVQTGRYASAEEAVNAAVARMRGEEMRCDDACDDMDDADLAAVEDGSAQLDRGEGRPLDVVRAQLQARGLSS